jgi:hypothetical protein
MVLILTLYVLLLVPITTKTEVRPVVMVTVIGQSRASCSSIITTVTRLNLAYAQMGGIMPASTGVR